MLFLMFTLVGGEKAKQWRRERLPVNAGALVCGLPGEKLLELQEAAVERQKEDMVLPAVYDYRKEGRAAPVRDQGRHGTCWAFASLTALETSLMPEEEENFSRDHLNYHNGYFPAEEEGGSYIMSVAYLTAWQGPVLEEEDPYGDGVSPEGLEPVKHVQEVRIPGDGDYQTIKQTVYLHGGVESSLYVDFMDSGEDSDYYDKELFSYCYDGEEEPNHDVVIIGWDDFYPAENFKIHPPGDGAFICQNSWGTGFGQEGIFYVSYYDVGIGRYNVAYTKVEDTDNYDVIHQSDLCGWSGQIGYHIETASFANVYQADCDQELLALGFYVTGPDTQYRLAVVPEFENKEDLEDLEYVQIGYLQYTGYYTIRLNEPVKLKEGQRFAVAVQLVTPESKYPIAVEYSSEEMGGSVVLEDGEGYISPDGKNWENTEENHKCNLCLKAYGKRKEG